MVVDACNCCKEGLFQLLTRKIYSIYKVIVQFKNISTYLAQWLRARGKGNIDEDGSYIKSKYFISMRKKEHQIL